MIDLGSPVGTTRWPHEFAEVGSARLIRRIPDQLRLQPQDESLRGLQLTIVGASDQVPLGILGGELKLAHSGQSPHALSADLHEIWGRVAAIVRIGEPPATTAWQHLGLDGDVVHLVGVGLEHHAAQLVEQEILEGQESGGMVSVELIVGAQGLRMEQPATVAVEASVLVGIASDLGPHAHDIAEMYAIIDRVLQRFGSSWGVIESSGPIDDVNVREELIHRLVELGGVSAVSGPSLALAPTSAFWAPPPMGDVNFDLRSQRPAAVRRHLSVGLGMLVANLDSDTRRALIKRHHSISIITHHTIAVWPRSLPPDVGTIVGEVRHPEGTRLRTDTFIFDGRSSRHTLFHGHTHLGASSSRQVSWTLQLVPGPLMIDARMDRVMNLEGKRDLSALTRLSCGLEAFDISICTITVDSDVLEVATGWRADLVINGMSIASTNDQQQAGSRPLVVPADVEVDAVTAVVEVHHEPLGTRIQVIHEPGAAGTHIRVGLAHVLTERPTVDITLDATAREAVLVVVDLWRDPAQITRIEMRPGDDTKSWRIPANTVFEQNTPYFYSQRWLLPPSRSVDVAVQKSTSRRLILKPPE